MNAISASIPISIPAFAPPSALPTAQLEHMVVAGEEIQESYRVLKKAGLNIVGECLRGQGTFFQMNHYPEGDVYDAESHSQYYYHNHREDMDEHGHFHTFMRASGMQKGTSPIAYNGKVSWPSGNDAVSHIIAISMDSKGFPLGIFATNRWVTGETWYTADDVINMIDAFDIDHAFPNLPVNRWISAMLRLYRPEIAALLTHRDEVIEYWASEHSKKDVFEDRNLEITGELSISVEDKSNAIKAELANR